MPRHPGAPGLGINPSRRGGRDAAVPEPATVTASEDYPELAVEWAPDDGPNVADPTWVALTEHVSEGATKRGRNYQLDRFAAGTLSLTLKATTRLFDPENTAGVYYGKLLPMRQVRVRAKWAGVWYPVWRGYVVSWGTTVVQNSLFVTTVSCSDAFLRLEQKKLPSSAWAYAVQNTNPSMWFRLGEDDTLRATDVGSSGAYGIYEGVTQGQSGLVPGDGDGSILCDRASNTRVRVQNFPVTTLPMTFACLFKMTSKVAYQTGVTPTGVLFGIETDNPSYYLRVDVAGASTSGTSGYVGVQGALNGSDTIDYTTTTLWDDLTTHHLAAVISSTGTATIYLDGVEQPTVVLSAATAASWFTNTVRSVTIGNMSDQFDASNRYAFPGYVDEVTVWNRALSSTQIAGLALAAKSGWSGDDSGSRAARLLDAIGWPTSLRDVSTGISTLQAASWSAGTSALAVLQDWADTELGAFFVGKDGKIIWRNRHYPLLNARATRTQVTFSDTGTAGTVRYREDDYQAPRDETQIRNPVTANRANGVAVQVRDDNLADQVYGDRNYASPTTQDLYDHTVRDRATWILNRYKNVQTRLARLTVQPRRDPDTAWPAVLGLELGDRITVENTPAGLDNQVTLEQIVETIEHRFSPTRWATSFTGSPADPGIGTYLILDDATSGLLDTGLLAY